MTTLYEKIIETEYGFDIADKTYDIVVYIEFDFEKIQNDDYDKVISKICKMLEVHDDLKNGDIAHVDLTSLYEKNKKLQDYIEKTFDFNIEDEEEKKEYVICTIFPQLISGGVPDRVYTELAKEVFNNEFDIRKEFEDIAKKFDFKVKNKKEEICICARNTDGRWIDWIKYDFSNSKVSITGNTDQCNLWFCDTRKDMTPELILDLVANLNETLRKVDSYVTVKTLIDPEDWQVIANVEDAYKDDCYKIEFKCIEFEDNSYIHFTLLYKNREFDGLFRIHDPANGPDMTVVSIYNCCVKEYMDFANAHWEEIENELCEYANERLKNIEHENEQNNSEECEEEL